jgi:sugar phosphate isomerase/epimerase
MLWIMGAVDKVNVGTCLDTGHAFLSGDIYTIMYKLSGHLQMIHAADNLGQYDDHLPPGKGKIDWRQVLRKLNATRFQGGFILEMAGDTKQDAEVILDSARRARRYLRDISRTLELSKPPTVEVVKQE